MHLMCPWRPNLLFASFLFGFVPLFALSYLQWWDFDSLLYNAAQFNGFTQLGQYQFMWSKGMPFGQKFLWSIEYIVLMFIDYFF